MLEALRTQRIPVIFFIHILSGLILGYPRGRSKYGTMASNDNAEECQWIHLNTGKAFSRLLYTNPVCFVCTRCAQTTFDSMSTSCAKDNVMVLSWLTATNNEGRFIFSIHKSRYSASLLAPPTVDNTDRIRSEKDTDNNCNHTNNFQVGIEFTLSVPIKGLEQVVLDVGLISGRYGSKYPADKHNNNDNDVKNEEDTNIETLSNRQRKRQRVQQLTTNGVPGLVAVPFGNVNEASQSSLFAIKGTVAHLKCKTYAVMGSSIGEEDDERSRHGNEKRQSDDKIHSPIIDDDHLLIMAEVTDAHVHSSYWDDKKQLFRPQSSEVLPYLKFFGSQTFGYVTSGE